MFRIGPLEFESWHLLLLAAGAVFAWWIIRGFMIRVSGTWERVDEGLKPGQSERITLVQFGPFVRGRRMVKGGFQELNGIMRGRSILMNRRDHGQEMIVDQGFPKEIAQAIDGSVTARMSMTLSADGRAIFGTFTPQKIEFTYRPPEITRRIFLEPSYRRYKLISRDILDEAPAPLEERTSEEEPPPSPLRRTL